MRFYVLIFHIAERLSSFLFVFHKFTLDKGIHIYCDLILNITFVQLKDQFAIIATHWQLILDILAKKFIINMKDF